MIKSLLISVLGLLPLSSNVLAGTPSLDTPGVITTLTCSNIQGYRAGVLNESHVSDKDGWSGTFTLTWHSKAQKGQLMYNHKEMEPNVSEIYLVHVAFGVFAFISSHTKSIEMYTFYSEYNSLVVSRHVLYDGFGMSGFNGSIGYGSCEKPVHKEATEQYFNEIIMNN